MHFLENYATSAGLRIKKVEPATQFYPLNFDRYIVVNFSSSNMAAKLYDSAQQVIDIIKPELDKAGITIVQLGDNKEIALGGVHRLAGLTNLSQTNYIIKNALLHVGTDSYQTHAASVLGTPIVALYSVSSPKVCGPYWNKEKAICLEPNFPPNTTYSINPAEVPKMINTIKIEQIVGAIGKQLNINFPKFTTYFSGELANTPVLETYPDTVVRPDFMPNAGLYIRRDKGGDDVNVYEQLRHRKCLIVTKTPLDVNILAQLRPNIERVTYEITKDYSLDFCKALQSAGLPFDLISFESDEFVNGIKLEFLDLPLINRVPPRERPEGIPDNARFKTNRRILSNGKFYLSHAHVEADIPSPDFNNGEGAIINSGAFWKDSAFYWIYS